MRCKSCIWLIAVLAVLTSAGCRTTNSREDTTSNSGAIELRGEDMAGPLLHALESRVRAMTVSRGDGPCPRIRFRAQRSMTQQRDPSVYVDGTLMQDTCILAQMSSADVEYVQIFTGGAARPAGVQNNPFGTIIVQRIRR